MDADSLGLTSEEFEHYRELRLMAISDLPVKFRIMWGVTKEQFGDTEYTLRRTLIAYIRKQPLEDLIEIFYKE